MSATSRARIEVLGAALLFSTGGAAIKATTWTGWQVAGARSAVAAMVVALLLPEARRPLSRRILPAAIAYAATLVLFVTATKLTTAGAAIFLQSTAPAFVLLAGPWLLDEPIHRRDLGIVVLVLGGLALVFAGSQNPQATAPHPVLGNVIALASGVAYALLLITFRRLARVAPAGVAGPEVGEPPVATDSPALAAMLWGNALAAIAAIPFLTPLPAATTRDLAAIGYLGSVQIGLAYFLFTRGIRHLAAFEVSLLVLVEPVLNPLWTWLFHGEAPGALAIVGGATLLAATLLRTLLARRAVPA